MSKKLFSSKENTQKYFLRLYRQGQFVASHSLQLGTNLVGRDESNQISIDSTYVSRHHFAIEIDKKGNAFIQDLKSRNGTFINRQRISKVNLFDQDKVICGPFEFIYIGKAKPKLQKDSKSAATKTYHHGELSETYEQKVNDKISASMGSLQAAETIPPTREADMSVMPDRLVPIRKTPISKIVAIACGMLLFSAAMAFGMFKVMQKRWERSLLVDTNLSNKSESPLEDQNSIKEKKKPVQTKANVKSKFKNSKKRVSNTVVANKGVKTNVQKNSSVKNNKTINQSKGSKSIIDKASSGFKGVIGNLLKDKNDYSRANSLSNNAKNSHAMKQFISKSSSISVNVSPPPTNYNFGSSSRSAKKMSPDKYNKLIKSHLYFIQDCYVAHATNIEKAGQIKVSLSLNEKGQVQQKSFKAGHYSNSKLNQCLNKGVGKMKITSKPPWSLYKTNYTFKFSGMRREDFR